MRVLFVDDEPKVLDSIRRQLRKTYEVHTALSGHEALLVLEETPDIAIVVSDMRMPEMNGAELLAVVRRRYPHCIRMILSGQADIEAAISAVNEGNIFRFLTKPCKETSLRAALSAGIDQYQLTATRRVLLEKTLQGLVETLTDILGLTNPVARHRTARVRQYAAAIAGAMHFAMPWDLRLAALLSQIGCITLPDGILDKVYAGTELSAEERDLYARHPAVAAALIERIPRLESVAAMIRSQQNLDFRKFPADTTAWDSATTSLVILATASRLDELLATGDQPATALRRLKEDWPDIPVKVATPSGLSICTAPIWISASLVSVI
ncbi:MAG: response regulator [Gammaproteobacteria bacterium]